MTKNSTYTNGKQSIRMSAILSIVISAMNVILLPSYKKGNK